MVLSRFRHFLDVLRSLWPRSAVRLSRKGAHLRDQGKLDEAIAVLDQAISLNPQLAAAYAYRCTCYCDRQEHTKAIEDANRAIALAPKTAWVYWFRSWSWYCLDKLDSALADMDEALRLEPQNASFQHSRAHVLFKLGRIDEASAQYDAALVQDPKFKKGWLGAKIALKRGKWKEAIELFDVVVEADPTNARVYYDRGEAWYRLYEYEKALCDLDETVRLAPESAVFQYFRAQILLELGRIEEASTEYEAALVRKPGLEGGWLSGAIALKRGMFREAIEQFDAVLTIDPTRARVYCDRGEAWYRLGEYKNALRDLDEAAKRAPDHAVFHLNRAKTLCALARYADADRELREAMERYSDRADVCLYYALFMATCPQAELRNGKLAVAMALKVVELAGGKPNSKQCAILAAAYAETGDFAEAIRWQSESLATATEKGRSTQQARLEQYQAGTPLRMPDGPDSES